MKKIWIILLVISLVGIGILVLGRQRTTAQVEQAPVSTDLTELINNISVPYPVLLDAQMEHPGFAVMNAEKVNRDGSDRYRLHIQSSDQNSGRTSLFLLYDMEWRLMGEETFVAPPPVFHEQPQPAEQPQQPEGDDSREDSGDQEEDEEDEEELQEQIEEMQEELEEEISDIQPIRQRRLRD